MSATIYDAHGTTITGGIQGHRVSDEAFRAARRIAADRGEAVYLDDDGTHYTVHPDGTLEHGWESDREWNDLEHEDD